MSEDLDALAKRDEEEQAEWRRQFEAQQIESVKRERAARYQTLCPDGYKDTVPSKIPNQEAMKKVLAWTPGPRGLLLKGNTGRGKTRSVWLMLKPIIENTATTVMAYNGVTWALAVSRAFRETDETEGFINRVAKVDILVLDDIFKASIMSDTQARALYCVLEERMAWKRPTIMTTNSSGKDLLMKLPEIWRGEDGESLLRRIRESAEIVQF